MSSQYFPSRYDDPRTITSGAPTLVQASGRRRWTAALLDLLVVLGPLATGLLVLRDGSAWGWVGIGVGCVFLLVELVLPLLQSRSLFMAAYGLKLLDLDTGEPIRPARTLLRHVWPPARGEVCDLRPHVVAATTGERPSTTLVPPLGPQPVPAGQVSGALIADVPGRPTGAGDVRRAEMPPAPLPRPVTAPVAEARTAAVAPSPSPSPPTTRPEVEDSTVARPLPAMPPTTDEGTPAGGWHLHFEAGERLPVTGRVLLGRDPVDAPGQAFCFAIDDPGRSLSKTHAVLRMAGDALVVEDLASTNGTRVTRGGARLEVSPRTPFQLQDGDEVHFGDVRAVVEG